MHTDQHLKSQKNILIVDDTPDNLRLLSQLLTEHGYRVRAATNGRQALESASLAPPDLILLDIKMPEMDGFATCTALKAARQTQDVPVLFISALDDVADKVRAFKVGGLDYITKPFQPEEVLARVETHLALRNLQQRLQRANCKMTRELALAGRVQASFLPDKLPQVPGWDFAVTLLPAQETSGDYYDIFELPDGRFGILVADVVNKGVCAALFMALTYALFRTHAAEQERGPTSVFEAVNSHILHDTHANQFVTAFYGILDPVTGTLVYSNAGHCPGLLLSRSNSEEAWLSRTGIPLGILIEETWEQESVTFAPGDVLLLYTDGVIEAEGEPGMLYGRKKLLACARKRARETTAVQLKEEIIRDVQQFAGQHPPADDLVLFVVSRRSDHFL